MTTVTHQGHWHQLGHVDVRLPGEDLDYPDGIVIAYDTHRHPIAMIPLEELCETKLSAPTAAADTNAGGRSTARSDANLKRSATATRSRLGGRP